MKVMIISNNEDNITENYKVTDEEAAIISKFLKLCYIEQNLFEKCETSIDFVNEIELLKEF